MRRLVSGNLSKATPVMAEPCVTVSHYSQASVALSCVVLNKSTHLFEEYSVATEMVSARQRTFLMQKISVYQPETRILSALDSLNLTTWASECISYGVRFLFIDLKYVSFMDSRGLGALLIVHNRVERAGGCVGFCGLNGQARMLMEMTDLDKVFHVYDSYEEFEKSLTTFQAQTVSA
jgi:anti-anti-sigma factor